MLRYTSQHVNLFCPQYYLHWKAVLLKSSPLPLLVCPLKSSSKNLSKLSFLEKWMRIVISGHHPPPFSLSSMGFYHRMRFIIEDWGPHHQHINHHHHHQYQHYHPHYQDEVHHRGPWSPELCQEERFQWKVGCQKRVRTQKKAKQRQLGVSNCFRGGDLGSKKAQLWYSIISNSQITAPPNKFTFFQL